MAHLAAQIHYSEARLQQDWSNAWTAACVKATETGKGAGASAWANRLERRFPNDFKPIHRGGEKPAVAYDDVARRRSEKIKAEAAGGD